MRDHQVNLVWKIYNNDNKDRKESNNSDEQLKFTLKEIGIKDKAIETAKNIKKQKNLINKKSSGNKNLYRDDTH